MRAFARPSGLERLSLEARLVYSGFCLFMLVGFGTSAWLYADDGMFSGTAATAQYYRGGEESAGVTAGNDAGPEVQLPKDDELRLAKPPRQVIETFHFHLFSVPVCLLIVAHLFMMCALKRVYKAGIVVVAYVATFLHLVVPPLVRLRDVAWAVAMGPSAAAMTLTWTIMLLWPLIEMWLLLPRQRQRVR